MPIARALLAFVGIVLVVGCGEDGDEGAATGASALEGVPWVVVSGLETAGWEQTPPSVTFADGTVSGSSGCNRFTGSYSVDGDTLELGEIATTEMACPPPVMAVEREFVDAFGQVTAWRSDGDELVLSDGEGRERLRLGLPSPAGRWEATMVRQRDAVASLLPGTEITAEFADDGTLSGSAGCNTYTATYTSDRGAMTISEPASTRKACLEPEGVAEQEQAYLAVLPLAVAYRVEGSTLSLLKADGTFVATYTRAP
jgi:heat shock protein HslJ